MQFELETILCPSCNKPMMVKDKSGLFPTRYYNNQDDQMRKLGVVYTSKVQIEDDTICVECEKAGLASFTCNMCKQKRSSDALQESFGIFPTEYLCKNCYNTAPASTWEKEVNRLNQEHRWDFE
jgi:hypothetical protein